MSAVHFLPRFGYSCPQMSTLGHDLHIDGGVLPQAHSEVLMEAPLGKVGLARRRRRCMHRGTMLPRGAADEDGPDPCMPAAERSAAALHGRAAMFTVTGAPRG